MINGYEIYTTELPNHFLVSSKSSTTLHHVVLSSSPSYPLTSTDYVCDCEWYMHTGFKQHVCNHVEAAQQALPRECVSCCKYRDDCSMCHAYNSTTGVCAQMLSKSEKLVLTHAARRGAKHLDRVRPNWRTEINPNTLDMCTNCIVDQLTSSLDGYTLAALEKLQIPVTSDVHMGFNVTHREKYTYLTEAWKQLL